MDEEYVHCSFAKTIEKAAKKLWKHKNKFVRKNMKWHELKATTLISHVKNENARQTLNNFKNFAKHTELENFWKRVFILTVFVLTVNCEKNSFASIDELKNTTRFNSLQVKCQSTWYYRANATFKSATKISTFTCNLGWLKQNCSVLSHYVLRLCKQRRWTKLKQSLLSTPTLKPSPSYYLLADCIEK